MTAALRKVVGQVCVNNPEITGTLTGVGFESDVDYIGFDNEPGPYLWALSSSSADVIELRSW